jgi:hypothetical protein
VAVTAVVTCPNDEPELVALIEAIRGTVRDSSWVIHLADNAGAVDDRVAATPRSTGDRKSPQDMRHPNRPRPSTVRVNVLKALLRDHRVPSEATRVPTA